jgi:hypothetical protein
MGEEGRTCGAGKRELAGLAGYCSHLAGDNLCRCGGNLKGRYCLWSYYPLPPGAADLAAPGSDGGGAKRHAERI